MADNIVPVRACTKCGESKPETNEFFAKLKTGRCGLASQCKECAKAYAKALRLKNPGYSSLVAKRYRQKHHERVLTADRKRNAERREYCREKARQWRLKYPERAAAATSAWRARNAEYLRHRNKEYRIANRDRIKRYLSAWYIAHQELAKAYAAARRKAYPERSRAYAIEWYRKNTEKARANHKLWAQQNPDRRRVHAENRRARKRNGHGKLSPGLVQKLLRLQRHKCACCGKPLVKYHLDHIVPLARGGAHADWNMQLLTPTCNMRKGAKAPEDFARERGMLI